MAVPDYLKKLPYPLLFAGKAAAIYPRYWYRLSKCRKGFREFGTRYPNPILFVAGMPKSGTTWVEQMISSFPGYHEMLIPEATLDEMRQGEGHTFEIPEHAFSRFDRALVLTKMHVPGTKNNASVLRKHSIPYVILYRDLRDVAISQFHYVRNTPWHGDYQKLRECDVQEGIRHFIEFRAQEFVDWMEGWRANRDPDHSVMISYEELLTNTHSVLKTMLDLYGLEADEEAVRELSERFSFKRLSGGRAQGEDNKSSFFRKGVAGDWKNVFTDELKEAFKAKAGQTLIDFGYEENLDW